MNISLLEGKKVVLLGQNVAKLEKLAQEYGEPAFRGRQIHEWLYQKGVRKLEEISVLPKLWRTTLSDQGVCTGRLEEVKRLVANDGTIKLLLETSDRESIEAVGIPTNSRLTTCVSSQVGCSMGCRFCATGKGGFQRSLEVHEIVDQVLSIREAFDRRPSHIVFMGMGEPLLNIESVLESISCLNNDLGIGQRRITVSTVGVVNTLPQLAELALAKLGRVQFTLALSLHAPNQHLREMLVPSAKVYPIQDLLSDCRHYLDITGRRISFEYILLATVNDKVEHAEELADLISGFQSHVNLIAYNPIDEEDYQRPSLARINRFMTVLQSRGVAVSLRASRGLDQDAACGQLRHQHTRLD